MNKQEAIRNACETMALAYRSIGDYSKASDGFCYECEDRQGSGWTYSNQGEALAYVRNAVLQQLKRDGFAIDEGYDPETGNPVA